MRPQAGVGKLKHAPPMQANNLLLVAEAVAPGGCARELHLFTGSEGASTELANAPLRSRLGLGLQFRHKQVSPMPEQAISLPQGM
jgi:hypothetical protein